VLAAAVANTLLHRCYRREKRRSETRGPQVTKTKIIKKNFFFLLENVKEKKMQHMLFIISQPGEKYSNNGG
jgi:hypothetical protein